MDVSQIDRISRIQRSYAMLIEAAALLERAGEDDVAALLYAPLGRLEERFDLTPSSDSCSESQSNSRSSRSS